MQVIASAKFLADCVFSVTENSPKKYRLSLVSKMQTTSLDIISSMYAANEIHVDLKLLKDIDKSIRATEKISSFKNDEERYFIENKLFTLKLTRAQTVEAKISGRLEKQYEAMVLLKELDYLLVLSRNRGAILPKQLNRASKHVFDTRNLLGAWITSDKKRFGVL